MEGKENERAVAATKKEEGDAAENPRLPKAVEWLPVLISSKHFFQPCAKCTQRPLTSSEIHKASVNYLCLNCADPRGVCQLCMQEHANHHILQIRRSSYHDVVRERELSKLINTEGIQTYIINSSQVVFLRERPQSRNKAANFDPRASPGGCVTCGRHLHEGLRYCSLGCKVHHCTQGQPIGKQLPPGLELAQKPQGLGYWVDFQPNTPQLKPKSPGYRAKRQKTGAGGKYASMGSGAKGDGLRYDYYSGSGTNVSHGFHRHRRKKNMPRKSPHK